MAANDAEAHFETYLAARRLCWQYELPAGDNRPDYWIDTPAGCVVCEVRHVTAHPPSGGSALDPYKPLAKAIGKKAKQSKALDGVHPYVVVLWAPHWPTDEIAVTGAMFGRIEIVMPFDGERADSTKADYGFGRDAKLHPAQHPHVSAVAVITRFNPTLRAVQVEQRKLLAGVVDRDEQIGIILDLYERRTADGALVEEARQPRLRVFHNYYASTPLDFDVFDGPWDQQHGEFGDRYTVVAEGVEVPNLPD